MNNLISKSEGTSKQPKTIFLQILTDDQGWGDLQSYGHVFIQTPNINKLAEEGIKFTHCYSSAAYTKCVLYAENVQNLKISGNPHKEARQRRLLRLERKI